MIKCTIKLLLIAIATKTFSSVSTSATCDMSPKGHYRRHYISTLILLDYKRAVSKLSTCPRLCGHQQLIQAMRFSKLFVDVSVAHSGVSWEWGTYAANDSLLCLLSQGLLPSQWPLNGSCQLSCKMSAFHYKLIYLILMLLLLVSPLLFTSRPSLIIII